MDRGPDATARIAEWARSYRHRLVLVALQLVGNEDDAEDVVQDVLARELSHALADPQTLDGVSNPYGRLAWLTRNAARDAWRKQARRARILRDNDTEVREQLRPAPDLGWVAHDQEAISKVMAGEPLPADGFHFFVLDGDDAVLLRKCDLSVVARIPHRQIPQQNAEFAIATDSAVEPHPRAGLISAAIAMARIWIPWR